MDNTTQLELFELPKRVPPQRGLLPTVSMTLRQDHAVLMVIGGLIGCSIVFASGVERGKQLGAADRPLLPIPQTAANVEPKPVASPTPAPVAQAPVHTPAAAAVKTAAPAATKPAAPKTKEATPAKPAKSKFAIQVVTYSQLALAQREMQRLQSKGEQAFLIQKNGRTVLYIGPFPDRELATAKLTSLKPRYGDCILRTL